MSQEVFIDDSGNVTDPKGFDGKTEPQRVEEAKAELLTEQFGQPQPLILGKFTSADALAQSYQSLESEAGRLRAELAALKATPSTPPATVPPERQQQIMAAMLAQAGGEDGFARIAQWAGTNLPKAETEAFNAALLRGDEGTVMRQLKAIQFDMLMNQGYEPQLIGGKGAPVATIKPFNSEAEVAMAMSDPRYSGGGADPAYIAEVEERLSVSPNLFPGR